jgi:hypothetical protein
MEKNKYEIRVENLREMLNEAYQMPQTPPDTQTTDEMKEGLSNLLLEATNQFYALVRTCERAEIRANAYREAASKSTYSIAFAELIAISNSFKC